MRLVRHRLPVRLLGDRHRNGRVARTSDEFECMGVRRVGRTVTRVIDADHHEFEFASTSPGIPESRMTIRYARRK